MKVSSKLLQCFVPKPEIFLRDHHQHQKFPLLMHGALSYCWRFWLQTSEIIKQRCINSPKKLGRGVLEVKTIELCLEYILSKFTTLIFKGLFFIVFLTFFSRRGITVEDPYWTSRKPVIYQQQCNFSICCSRLLSTKFSC